MGRNCWHIRQTCDELWIHSSSLSPRVYKPSDNEEKYDKTCKGTVYEETI